MGTLGVQARGRFKHVRNQQLGVVRNSNISLASEGPAGHTLRTLVERVANVFHIYPVPGLEKPFLNTGLGPDKVHDTACLTSVSRVSQKAKVWVSSVISKVQRQETRPHMHTWFGATAAATRKEVLRVLNSIEAVMTNFRYVFLPPHPDACDDTTYAFVMADGLVRCNEATLRTAECRTDSAGRKVVYLCNLYCQSSEKVQVETLTHESSHHLPADTDDVPPEPYGREDCLNMARDRPQAAIRNADNYCFYVMDVIHNLGSGQRRRRRGSRCPNAASRQCGSTPCSCSDDMVKVNEGGCVHCIKRCPSAASGACDELACGCAPGERKVNEDGCFYCSS